MVGKRGLVLALAACLGALLLAAPSGAQDGGSSGDADVSPGYLYLTDQEVGQFPGTICRPAGETLPVWGLAPEVPRDTEMRKTYTGKHLGPADCTTSFVYQAQEGFTMGPGTHVTFWIGCDHPTPGLTAGRVEPLTDYRVTLSHDGEQVTQSEGYYGSPFDPVAGCAPAFSPIRLEAPLDPPETSVSAGDNVTVNVALFNLVSERDNVHIAVQSRETPSTLYGPGLPGVLRDSPRSDLLVDVGNRSSSAGPGNATTYPFTVENIGDEVREVSLSVDGPDAWFAEPSPASLEVPAGETVEANLTVAAPRDLTSGTEARHLVTVASSEEEVTFGATTTVVPDAGTALEEVLDEGTLDAASPDGGAGEDDLSVTEGGPASDDGGGFLDEFGVELAATAVAGVAAFVGKELLL